MQNTEKRLIPYAKSKHVHLEMENVTNLPFMIMGNDDVLSQAIGNVIKNAIDYNRENGKVVVSLEKKRELAVVSVKDTGIGISSQHLQYIFNRFYKGEESRSEHKGSGLGLAIAKDIITRHKGTIIIQRTSAKGTKVRISLPLTSTS